MLSGQGMPVFSAISARQIPSSSDVVPSSLPSSLPIRRLQGKSQLGSMHSTTCLRSVAGKCLPAPVCHRPFSLSSLTGHDSRSSSSAQQQNSMHRPESFRKSHLATWITGPSLHHHQILRCTAMHARSIAAINSCISSSRIVSLHPHSHPVLPTWTAPLAVQQQRQLSGSHVTQMQASGSSSSVQALADTLAESTSADRVWHC